MCTDFILPLEDANQAKISARTMDYGNCAASPNVTDLVKVPAGLNFESVAPTHKHSLATGHKWVNTYGFVGTWLHPATMTFEKDMAGDPTKLTYNDGLNTAGLSAAVLWLDYSEYEEPGKAAECLEIAHIAGYVLGTCATVAQAREKLDELTVWAPEIWENLLANHLCVHDANGDSLVLEFTKANKVYYNNTIGVLTNGPTFDIHATQYNYHYKSMTNKDNNRDRYIQLNEDESGVYNIQQGNGFQFEVLSAGTFGLPGDSTSPSRFVRTAVLRQLVPQTYDNRTGVQYALQILGRIAVCEQEVLTLYNPDGKPEEPRATYNPTLWQLVRDHSDKILYYSTRLNHNLYAVRLNNLSLDKGSASGILPMENNQWCTDNTAGLDKSVK